MVAAASTPKPADWEICVSIGYIVCISIGKDF